MSLVKGLPILQQEGHNTAMADWAGPAFPGVDDTSPHASVEADQAELSNALEACDFPIIVWDLPAATVGMVNEPTEAMLGYPSHDLSGRKATEFLLPTLAVEHGFAAFRSGGADFIQARRDVRVSGGHITPTYVWAKSVELDDDKRVVSILIPAAEVGRLGRDPSRPWKDLAPIVIGIADSEWCVLRISADISTLVGRQSTELVGKSLLDLVRANEVAFATSAITPSALGNPHIAVHLAHVDGTWVPACLVARTMENDGFRGVAFALIGVPPLPRDDANRAEKLAMHLHRIGAEVRAAGVLDAFEALPDSADHPQLSELTGRQMDIVERLLKGQRVPSMAKDLYISQSTIRNHLAAIFQKFGVHSQAELLEVLSSS